MGLALFFLFVRSGENFRLTCTVSLDASSTAGSIVRRRSMRGHRSNKSTITLKKICTNSHKFVAVGANFFQRPLMKFTRDHKDFFFFSMTDLTRPGSLPCEELQSYPSSKRREKAKFVLPRKSGKISLLRHNFLENYAAELHNFLGNNAAAAKFPSRRISCDSVL